MTNEASLNTIIANSFSQLPLNRAIKISDPRGGIGIQNPFDHFGVYNGKPLYSESKILKKLESFAFSKIEDHQYENLSFFSKALSDKCYTLIFLGIYVPHKMKILMTFDFDFLYEQKLTGKKSFFKKELDAWIEKGMFLDINYKNIEGENGKMTRKEIISSLEELDSKIIRGFNDDRTDTRSKI